MIKGESSSSQLLSQKGMGALLLPLGNVACGVLHYIASWIVVGHVYTQILKPGRQTADGSVFMACFIGLIIGTFQAAVIRRLKSPHEKASTTVNLRWPLATAAGYSAWAVITKLCLNLFTPTLSSIESYVLLTSERIVAILLIVLVAGVAVPGITIGTAQYLSLTHKTAKARQWPLIQTLNLFLAIALPVILPALVILPIAAANPGSDGSVIVLAMFIGFPAWLLLASVFGCCSIQITNRWLVDNVFPPRTGGNERARVS